MHNASLMSFERGGSCSHDSLAAFVNFIQFVIVCALIGNLTPCQLLESPVLEGTHQHPSRSVVPSDYRENRLRPLCPAARLVKNPYDASNFHGLFSFGIQEPNKSELHPRVRHML